MEKAPFVVGRCIFTENILKEIDEYKSLLTKVNNNNHLFFTSKSIILFTLVMYKKCKRTKIFITFN
jgi:hypothetical protein